MYKRQVCDGGRARAGAVVIAATSLHGILAIAAAATVAAAATAATTRSRADTTAAAALQWSALPGMYVVVVGGIAGIVTAAHMCRTARRLRLEEVGSQLLVEASAGGGDAATAAADAGDGGAEPR